MACTGIDININTPVAEILRRIMVANGAPMTVGELTERLQDVWGRNLPCNPYKNVCLVYKLAASVLHCHVSYERLEGGIPPYVSRTNPDDEMVAVTPGMRFEGMNQVDDGIQEMVLSLPE